jgi:alpha-glucosidase
MTFTKTLLASVAMMLSLMASAQPSNIVAKSPDGKTELQVLMLDKLNFTVQQNGQYLLLPTTIGITLADGTVWGNKPQLMGQSQQTVTNIIKPIYGQYDAIDDNYTELTVKLKDLSKIIFRVYNDGVAYRWVTEVKGPLTIVDEELTARFNHSVAGWMPDSQTYETSYTYKQASDSEKSRDLFLPLVIEGNNNKLVFTEADVQDYPSLFLRKSNDVEDRLVASFQKYPKTTKTGGYNNYNRVVTSTENYIAKTQGARSFPWRIIAIANSDKDLIANNIVYRLGKPTVQGDFSWVKPGKVVWDWWADYVIEGVDFKTGINTATYFKHVDFAAQNGIEYIIIDWKWTDRDDITLLNPEVDAPKIIAYAKEKGVRVIVWAPSYTLYGQLAQGLDMVAAMGAAGVKVDFFDRDDQQTIAMYEAIAKAAAERKLLVDFHGCTKPTGLERTYPNIINYEAVLGNEVNKWAADITPEHKVNLAFTRNLQGPMDFTPGGMRNVNRGDFMPRNTLPMVQDTRSAEMALYVVFYEPLKMFCDATSTYAKEMECFKFLATVPTSWNETKVVDAKAGDYVVVARRIGKTWYVAGITDNSARELHLDLSFIAQKNVQVESFTDGTNVSKVATDYAHKTESLDLTMPLTIKMASGGGFIIKINP